MKRLPPAWCHAWLPTKRLKRLRCRSPGRWRRTRTPLPAGSRPRSMRRKSSSRRGLHSSAACSTRASPNRIFAKAFALSSKNERRDSDIASTQDTMVLSRGLQLAALRFSRYAVRLAQGTERIESRRFVIGSGFCFLVFPARVVSAPKQQSAQHVRRRPDVARTNRRHGTALDISYAHRRHALQVE